MTPFQLFGSFTPASQGSLAEFDSLCYLANASALVDRLVDK